MRSSSREARFRRLIATVLACLAASPALADPLLDVQLDCPSTSFQGQNYALTDQTCSIDYSNVSGAEVSNVEFRLKTPRFTQTDIAPSLDGVPGLTPGDSHEWRMMNLVLAQAGSPTPAVDYDDQVFSWTLTSIGAGVTSELYFFMRTTNVFPDGDYEWTLETWVDEVLDSSQVVDVEWVGSETWATAILPPAIDPARHLVGTAAVRAGSAAVTDARIRVYLPYYHPATDTFLADQYFDPEEDTAVIDPDTLAADLFYRWFVPPSPYIAMPAATPPDADGNYSYPPDGEPNAGKLIVYDPDTNILTGTFGINGHQAIPNTWVHQYRNWRLRWDAEFNTFLPDIDDGTVIPVEVCVESVESGQVFPGDPLYCSSGQSPGQGGAYSEAGPEPDPILTVMHLGCPVGYVNCYGENRAYPPGQKGFTTVQYRSEATVAADVVELVAQVPGTPSDGAAAEVWQVRLSLGPRRTGTGPRGAAPRTSSPAKFRRPCSPTGCCAAPVRARW